MSSPPSEESPVLDSAMEHAIVSGCTWMDARYGEDLTRRQVRSLVTGVLQVAYPFLRVALYADMADRLREAGHPEIANALDEKNHDELARRIREHRR